jgi:hypothetical protein
VAGKDDRDPGSVDNEPTANRIGEIQRLFALVLLRHDPQVQQLYVGWVAICGRADLPHRLRLVESLQGTWDVWAPAPQAVLQEPDIESLCGELVGMSVVVQALGLAGYRWLPVMLWYTFAAEALGSHVEVTVPEGLAWEKAGKRPKTPGKQAAESGVAADSRIEDLERNMIWFYRHQVRHESPGAIALSAAVQKSTVKHALRRVRTLLAYLSP